MKTNLIELKNKLIAEGQEAIREEKTKYNMSHEEVINIVNDQIYNVINHGIAFNDYGFSIELDEEENNIILTSGLTIWDENYSDDSIIITEYEAKTIIYGRVYLG